MEIFVFFLDFGHFWALVVPAFPITMENVFVSWFPLNNPMGTCK